MALPLNPLLSSGVQFTPASHEAQLQNTDSLYTLPDLESGTDSHSALTQLFSFVNSAVPRSLLCQLAHFPEQWLLGA